VYAKGESPILQHIYHDCNSDFVYINRLLLISLMKCSVMVAGVAYSAVVYACNSIL